MKLVDILNGEPGLYILDKPSCKEGFPAYTQWEGVIVRKTKNGAVRFHDPVHTGFIKGDLIRLNGIVVKSEWIYLGGE